MQYEITNSTAQEVEYINDRLVAFNRNAVPFLQEPAFIEKNFVLKIDGEIAAGIHGMLYCWRVLYIDVLYVEERYRGQALGSLLLRKLEDEARAMGCKLAHLETFDFQAKDFYLRHGYRVFGTLQDNPPDHAMHFLQKAL